MQLCCGEALIDDTLANGGSPPLVPHKRGVPTFAAFDTNVGYARATHLTNFNCCTKTDLVPHRRKKPFRGQIGELLQPEKRLVSGSKFVRPQFPENQKGLPIRCPRTGGRVLLLASGTA